MGAYGGLDSLHTVFELSGPACGSDGGKGWVILNYGTCYVVLCLNWSFLGIVNLNHLLFF